jgi:hypothetical protein
VKGVGACPFCDGTSEHDRACPARAAIRFVAVPPPAPMVEQAAPDPLALVRAQVDARRLDALREARRMLQAEAG